MRMTRLFTDNDRTVWVDRRKIVCISRKSSKSYYLPLYRGEIAKLGLSENSFVKAEIARTEAYQEERPASEIQAELDKIKEELNKVLDEYDESTSIRKVVLAQKIQKVISSKK
jgi:hypothetical protein